MKKIVFLFLFFGTLSFIEAKPISRQKVNSTRQKKASASYYNPMDARQTKKNPDGKGAFGRKIKSGSIAFGSDQTEIWRKGKKTVFIKIIRKGFNVKTPYGLNIFRIDDAMNKRYRKAGVYYIDFFSKDLNKKHKKLGRFNVEFTIYKITKEKVKVKTKAIKKAKKSTKKKKTKKPSFAKATQGKK